MIANKIPKWSVSVARLGVSVSLLLAAWLLATCGSPPIPSSNGSTSGDMLFEYRRTGGIAGLDDHLTVRATGEATLEQKGGIRNTFTLDESTVSRLQRTVDEAEFFKLDSQYRPARPIPDAFLYRITYQNATRRHTVETTDGAIPEQLAPIIDELNQIIAQH